MLLFPTDPRELHVSCRRESRAFDCETEVLDEFATKVLVIVVNKHEEEVAGRSTVGNKLSESKQGRVSGGFSDEDGSGEKCGDGEAMSTLRTST